MKPTSLILLLLIFSSCESEEKKISSPSSQNNQPKEPIENKKIASEITDYQKVEFKSIDQLTVVGNYYEVDRSYQTIVLCHQARYNKFEYAGIAKRLNKMGFNCLAIDQRSGGPISTFQNETMINALNSKLSIDYLDAEQDMAAAVKWAYEKSQRPVILWGSSYSSTLALYIALSDDKVGAVISFSPGNYFAEKKGDLKEMLPNYKKPLFITSTKYESIHVKQFMSNVILGEKQIVFIPESEGYHGSQALWDGQPEGNQYWQAITEFLNRIR
jgi:hypothetical protein